MKLISNRLDYPFTLLRQELSVQLTPQQIRIAAVAVVLFALIALVYCALKTGACKWIYLGDVDASKAISHDIREVIQQKSNKIPIVSAKCLVHMKCEKENIKNEFILDHLKQKDVAEQQIQKLVDYLEQKRASLGVNDKVHYLVIFKDEEKTFHARRAEIQYSGIISAKVEVQRQNDKSAGEMKDYYLSVVDQLEFPVEDQIDNGEFVQGSLYVPL